MHRQFQPTVYIMASQRNGTIYTGVTSDLMGRIHQHREGILGGFTKEYGVKRLVWFEQHSTMEDAIIREKRIKKWNRAWKLELIENDNPQWHDLAERFGFPTLLSSSPRTRGPRLGAELGPRVREDDEGG